MARSSSQAHTSALWHAGPGNTASGMCMHAHTARNCKGKEEQQWQQTKNHKKKKRKNGRSLTSQTNETRRKKTQHIHTHTQEHLKDTQKWHAALWKKVQSKVFCVLAVARSANLEISGCMCECRDAVWSRLGFWSCSSIAIGRFCVANKLSLVHHHMCVCVCMCICPFL